MAQKKMTEEEIKRASLRGFRASELAGRPLVKIVKGIRYSEELPVLESWEKFFRRKNVPHFVMKLPSGFCIMKQLVEPYGVTKTRRPGQVTEAEAAILGAG